MTIDFDLVSSVCDHVKESCPIFPKSSKTVHKSFNDPSKHSGTANEKIADFKIVRDEIKQFAKEMVAEVLND